MLRLIAFMVFVAATSAEVVHPCADDPTRECFANYIAKVSGCIPPTSLPEVDSFEGLPRTIEMPYFRATIERYKATITGISNVEDFVLFYDTDKDITVLSYNFPSVIVFGREVISFHFPGEIDTSIDTGFRIIYTNVNVTAQWKGVDSITIGTAKLYTRIGDKTINFADDFPEYTAAVQADPDGVLAQGLRESEANYEISLRSQETPAGAQIVRPFWNNWLCTNLP